MNQYNLFIIISIVEIIFIVFLQRVLTYSGHKSISILYDPISLFLFATSIIYLLVPTFMVCFDWSWHHQAYSQKSYLIGNLVVFAYIMLVYLWYFFIEKQIINVKIGFKKIYNFQPLSKKQVQLLFIIFLIPVWLTTIYLVRYVFSFDLADYLRDRINLNRGKGLFILISSMGTVLVPILYAHFILLIKQHKKIIRFSLNIIFSALFIIPFLLAYTIMGSRLTAFIMLILLIFTFITVSNKTLSFKRMISYATILFSIFILFTLIGYIRILGGDISTIDWTLLLKVYEKEFETALVLNFGNFEHLVWLIEHPSRWDAFYGQTFLAGFMNILPRSIFENKLLGGGPYLKNIIHPGSYAFSRANISSYTTGIAIETFMNFKYLGLLIVPFFHALALQVLSRIVPRIKGNIILLSIYLYLLFSAGFLILFGEFLGQYTRALVVSIPFIFFYLFTNTGGQIPKNIE